jgi:hypothetical protein
MIKLNCRTSGMNIGKKKYCSGTNYEITQKITRAKNPHSLLFTEVLVERGLSVRKAGTFER